MKIQLYRPRIRSVFKSRSWLQLSLICTSVLVTGVEAAFAQAQREHQIEMIREIEKLFFGGGLLTFLAGVVSAFRDHLEIVSYAIGAAVTIGGALLAGKAIEKTGTLQVEEKKVLVTGAPGFMICAAGILIIFFGFLQHGLSKH